jgi:hypothetical protein
MKSKRSIRRSNMEQVSPEITNVDEIVSRGITSITRNHSMSNWVGTMTSLTTALNRVLSKHQRTLLPGSPSALRLVINRVANRLRSRGIGVRFGRTTDHSRTRFVKFTH